MFRRAVRRACSLVDERAMVEAENREGVFEEFKLVEEESSRLQ